MEYRSRLKNRVRNTLFKNTALSVVVIVVIVATVGFFGLQLLVNLSLFLGKIKSVNEIPSDSQSEFILAPRLNSLFEATNSAVIEVSGIGNQSGQTIEIYLNDEFKTKTLVDNDLQFSVSRLRLETGENTIKAVAKDGDNESEFSEEAVVLFEQTPPALEIQEPVDDAVIKNTRQVKVTGKTEPDATLSINSFLPIVDSSGKFTYTMPLVDGENIFKITAKDKAGNQTTNEIKVTFEP